MMLNDLLIFQPDKSSPYSCTNAIVILEPLGQVQGLDPMADICENSIPFMPV